MLTRNDRTVEDALDLLALIRPLGLPHIGFKDIGVSPRVLEKVAASITEAGAVSYMNLEVICPLRQIGHIITDLLPAGGLKKALASAGTEVSVARAERPLET